MCSRVKHHKNQFFVVLFPNEKPVGLNMAFPLAFAVAMKLVWKVFFWQFSIHRQDSDGFSNEFHVITPLFAKPHIAFKLARKLDAVHRLSENLFKQIIYVFCLIYPSFIKVSQRTLVGCHSFAPRS